MILRYPRPVYRFWSERQDSDVYSLKLYLVQPASPHPTSIRHFAQSRIRSNDHYHRHCSAKVAQRCFEGRSRGNCAVFFTQQHDYPFALHSYLATATLSISILLSNAVDSAIFTPRYQPSFRRVRIHQDSEDDCL